MQLIRTLGHNNLMELADKQAPERHLDSKELVDVVCALPEIRVMAWLTGSNFTQATALHGNDLSTFPDFPAEIRAPAGAIAPGFRLPDLLALKTLLRPEMT